MHQPFPSWRHNVDQHIQPRLVQSAEEEKALGPGWYRLGSEPAPEVKPEPRPAVAPKHEPHDEKKHAHKVK